MVTGTASLLAGQAEQEVSKGVARAGNPFDAGPLRIAEIEGAARLRWIVDHVKMNAANLTTDLQEVTASVE